jgi:hypothetical protein
MKRVNDEYAMAYGSVIEQREKGGEISQYGRL